MIILKVIWLSAVVLIALAICLWFLLLIVHLFASRKDKRMAVYAETWLDRLLDVMDGTEPPEVLPVPKSLEETEAVIGLLRTLTERFSGSYQQRMLLVLRQIRAVDYGMDLLRSRKADNKVRGCALLGWCGPNTIVDYALRDALNHRNARVVLEAASALVSRGVIHDIRHMILALCRSRAAKSLLARDLFRRWGEVEKSDWSDLFEMDWNDDGWVLLLEAAGASGRSEWVDMIIRQAAHPSPAVVRAALSALAIMGDPQGSEVAGRTSEHANPQVRWQAVKTIEACGTLEGSFDCLVKLLNDVSFDVRRAAFEAILKLGGRPRLMEMETVDYWQRELFREEGLGV